MYIKSAASRFPVIVFDLCSFYRLVCSLVVQDLGFYTRSRFLVASLLGMTKPLLQYPTLAVRQLGHCVCGARYGFCIGTRFLVASTPQKRRDLVLGMTSNALISRLPSDVSRGLRFSCLLQPGFCFPSYKAPRQPYLP